MPQKITAEQLKARQAQLQAAAAKQRKILENLRRRIDRETRDEELQRYAALGRAVAASLHITTAEAWERFCKESGCLSFVDNDTAADFQSRDVKE